MDVHHVTCFIIAHADVVLQYSLQAEAVEGILGGKVWRRQVEKAVRYVDFQVRVYTHGVAQGLGYVNVPVFVVCVRPG